MTGGVSLSAIDEQRFGIRTARALVSEATLPGVLDFCATHGVVLLIARCPVTDLPTVQAMERRGFLLMDTLVYYTRDLVCAPIPPADVAVGVRPLRPGEQVRVTRLAAAAFRRYFGHYHADARLDRSKCDDAYVSWATRSCTERGVADEVLVAADEDDIVGFATLRMNAADEGEGVLFGVLPSAQGRGIYRSLMVGGMAWCRSQGATRMAVSTQLTNVAVQKVWSRLGFEPSHAYYTMHKWFDD